MAIPLLSTYPIGSLKSLESASSYENNVTLLVDVIQFLRFNQNDFYTPILLALWVNHNLSPRVVIGKT